MQIFPGVNAEGFVSQCLIPRLLPGLICGNQLLSKLSLEAVKSKVLTSSFFMT